MANALRKANISSTQVFMNTFLREKVWKYLSLISGKSTLSRKTYDCRDDEESDHPIPSCNRISWSQKEEIRRNQEVYHSRQYMYRCHNYSHGKRKGPPSPRNQTKQCRNFNPFTAVLAAPSLGKWPIGWQIWNHDGFFAPSHECVNGFLSKCTVFKEDLL